jgi:hypothetical protein
MDDNLFDENDALDYVLFEECEKETKKNGGNSCYLGKLVCLLIMPVTGLLVWRCI